MGTEHPNLPSDFETPSLASRLAASFLPPQRTRVTKTNICTRINYWVGFFFFLSLHSSPFASARSAIYIPITNCTLENKEREERGALRPCAIRVHPGWMGTYPRDSPSCPAPTALVTLLRASILCLQSKSHLPAPPAPGNSIDQTQALRTDYSQYYSRANEIPNSARPGNRPVTNALGRGEF